MLSNIYARFFFDKTYVNICLNKCVYFDEKFRPTNNKSRYFLEVNGQNVKSNFLSINDLRLNKLYIYKYFSIYFYTKTPKKRYALLNSNIKNVFNLKCGCKIQNNVICSLTNFYVNYRLIDPCSISYSERIIFCIEGIEFIIEAGDLIISEKISFNSADLKEFQTMNLYNFVKTKNLNYEYDFEFNEDEKEFNESIVKYILPPVLMIFASVVVSIILKRTSFILFMVVSSVSTTLGSLLMLLIKKNRS